MAIKTWAQFRVLAAGARQHEEALREKVGSASLKTQIYLSVVIKNIYDCAVRRTNGICTPQILAQFIVFFLFFFRTRVFRRVHCVLGVFTRSFWRFRMSKLPMYYVDHVHRRRFWTESQSVSWVRDLDVQRV